MAKGGQFALANRGQFTPVLGGQFNWIFQYQVPNCLPNWPKFECLLNTKMPLRKINYAKSINKNPPSFDISSNEL